MKRTSILFFLFSVAVVYATAQQNPVVIELFTSQGCSSCPAADKNLTEILNKAKTDGQPVYGLSFHVDYWNYIGWKDPYSNKAFTERQRKYAEQLGLSSIYTPQMIVNGTNEFVGAYKNDSDRAIARALKQTAECKINIKELKTADNKVKLNFAVDHIENGSVVNVAIVEREVENYVPRGENSGRKLHHDNVVTYFTTLPLKQNHEVEINFNDFNKEKSAVIVYVQSSTLKVLGAASREF